MILDHCLISFDIYFIQLFSNSFIYDSIFENFYTSLSSGCILINSQVSLDVRRSLFSNITTTLVYEGSAFSGAAIYTSTITKDVTIAETCFKNCLSHHGYMFGCFGKGSAIFNQSMRTTSLSFSIRVPSYIYYFSSIVSSDVNTSESLDGTINLYSDNCNFKYYLVSNSYCSTYSVDFQAFFAAQAMTADFLSFINGTASKLFYVLKGISIGTLFVSTACGFGTVITKVDYLYYTSQFEIGNIAVVGSKEIAESPPEKLNIQNIICTIFNKPYEPQSEYIYQSKRIILSIFIISCT